MLLRVLFTALLFAACRSGTGSDSSRCADLPSDDSPEVARVGDIPITTDQIVKRLQREGSRAARRYADREALRKFVEDQIRHELLVRAALERGLDRDPDVVEAARMVMERKLLQRDLGPSIFAGEVAEEKILDYYNRHKDDYQQPEKRRLAHVQLAPTQEGMAQAHNILQKLKGRPSDHNLFRQQVAKHSLDTKGKSRGGEIPFKSRVELTDELGSTFAATAFRLSPGTLAPEPVQSTRGWHVVKVVSRREALTRSLAEVRGDIRERLLRQKRLKHFDKYLAEIKQRYPVALYEARLDDVAARMAAQAAESP